LGRGGHAKERSCQRDDQCGPFHPTLLSIVADIARGRLGGLLLQIGDHHLRGFLGKALRDLVADAARRSCDDGHFVFETPHDDTPSRSLLGQIVVHDLSEM